MGRTYTQIAIDEAKADLDRFAAELAASIAVQQAAQEAERHTARIAALVSTAGISAAGIHLSRTTPNRRLTRNELMLSAAQVELDSLAADIQAAIETGEPMPGTTAPEPAPVRLTGWAGIRQAAKAGKAYQKAYTDTYAAEMARSRR